eukprot:scaffold34116_cov108-Phaeocystis_antarctica.AAC.2
MIVARGVGLDSAEIRRVASTPTSAARSSDAAPVDAVDLPPRLVRARSHHGGRTSQSKSPASPRAAPPTRSAGGTAGTR